MLTNTGSSWITYFPGIPDTNTIAFGTFKEAFWPALYSGIIASLLTGVTVGFIVYFLQKYSERPKPNVYIKTLEHSENHSKLVLCFENNGATAIDSPVIKILNLEPKDIYLNNDFGQLDDNSLMYRHNGLLYPYKGGYEFALTIYLFKSALSKTLDITIHGVNMKPFNKKLLIR